MTDQAKRPRRGGFLSYERQLRITYALGLGIAVVYAALVIRSSDALGTLGYDFLAYDLAVDRLLAGQPIYDATAQEFGPFGLFFYPPPFLLLVLPVALLPQDLAIWTWTVLLTAASVVAVAVMPVARRTFWWVLLLAALSWPLLFAIKLGQVGPIALLFFAVGWRWLDQPRPLGLSIGLGTVIKIQPALLIGWAVVTGRRRAAVIAVALVAVLGIVATLLTGPGAWFDLASLLARVSKPIETPHAFGVGRLAFEAGASVEVATVVHWANFALAAVVVAVTVLRGSAVAGYMAVVVASQFLSPVLWDHYALVLLLPAAWLLDRGRLWAAAIPLATSTLLLVLQVELPAAYPIAFWVTLLALVLEGGVLRTLRAQGNRASDGILAA
jgi:alpha-1,2-mannosyltransferase